MDWFVIGLVGFLIGCVSLIIYLELTKTPDPEKPLSDFMAHMNRYNQEKDDADEKSNNSNES